MTRLIADNGRRLLLMAAVLLLAGIGVVSSGIYSAAMTISAEPLQNATSDGSIRYEADYSGASAVTRHESSDLTISGSDLVTTVTVQGTKASGSADVTVDLLDSSATVVDTATVALPSASGGHVPSSVVRVRHPVDVV